MEHADILHEIYYQFLKKALLSAFNGITCRFQNHYLLNQMVFTSKGTCWHPTRNVLPFFDGFCAGWSGAQSGARSRARPGPTTTAPMATGPAPSPTTLKQAPPVLASLMFNDIWNVLTLNLISVSAAWENQGALWKCCWSGHMNRELVWHYCLSVFVKLGREQTFTCPSARLQPYFQPLPAVTFLF